MKYKIPTIASKQLSLQKVRAAEKRRQEELKERRERDEALRLAVLAELFRQSSSKRPPAQRRNNGTK